MGFEEILAEQTKVQLKHSWKMPIAYVLGTVLLVLFTSTTPGNIRLRLNDRSQPYTSGDITTPGASILWVLFALVILTAARSLFYMTTRRAPTRWLSSLLMAPAGIGTVFGLFVHTGSGSNGVVTLTSLLVSTIAISTPLIFGSFSGIVSEYVGVVSIVIESDLLVDAFAGVMAISLLQTPYAGVVAVSLTGALFGPPLTFFSMKCGANQVIVGVVLNVLALGLTIFFYGALMKVSPQTLNTNQSSPTPIKISLFAEIPVIRPMLLNQTLLIYLMYLAIVFLVAFLYRFRWGLRLRTRGEYPKAADMVGISVNRTRGRDAILVPSFAGLGGASLITGSGPAFIDNISVGNGYIVLAAMILDKWCPLEVISAALMFGFTQAVAGMLPSVSPTIPSDLVSTIPYLVTIVAVTGFVGESKALAAENIPCVR